MQTHLASFLGSLLFRSLTSVSLGAALLTGCGSASPQCTASGGSTSTPGSSATSSTSSSHESLIRSSAGLRYRAPLPQNPNTVNNTTPIVPPGPNLKTNTSTNSAVTAGAQLNYGVSGDTMAANSSGCSSTGTTANLYNP